MLDDRSVLGLKQRWPPRGWGWLCVAGATLLLIGSWRHGSTRGSEPAQRNAASTADGSAAKVGEGMALMCTNNPAWVQWEIERGKRAIDSGADVVLVDTPMSSSFESGFFKAGWCDHCVRSFAKHLADRFSAEQLRQHRATCGLHHQRG